MPNSFRVLVTARSFCNTPGLHHEFLTGHGCEVVMAARTHPLTSNELAELIPGFDDAILGLDICDSSVIEKADRLHVISRFAVPAVPARRTQPPLESKRPRCIHWFDRAPRSGRHDSCRA